MANDHYDELVKQARELAGVNSDTTSMKLAELADAVEQLVAHLKCAENRQISITESHEEVWIDRDRIKAQLAHAEQQIAALREALGYYASGYLSHFMRTTDLRRVAKEALARDDEAAKKWA